MTIRPVTVEELPRVVDVGYAFYEEGALPGGFVPEVFVKNWTTILRNKTGQFFGAFNKDGKFVGGLGAVLCPDLNNGHRMAVECFWYVLPQHRGGGLRLLRAFEKWAKAAGARRVAMIHLLKLHPVQMRNLYERLGYQAIEVNYVKDL